MQNNLLWSLDYIVDKGGSITIKEGFTGKVI